MLAVHHQELVKATVPALQKQGEEITRVFYRDLLSAHPELRSIFNADNQTSGVQARRLAAAILAYAAHIDKLEQITGAVDTVAHKHVSLKVQPEHYPIVGEYLLKAIKTVFGEAATPEILEAWGAAYGQLAGIMIERERQMYAEASEVPAG